jgi:hypothetical protein
VEVLEQLVRQGHLMAAVVQQRDQPDVRRRQEGGDEVRRDRVERVQPVRDAESARLAFEGQDRVGATPGHGHDGQVRLRELGQRRDSSVHAAGRAHAAAVDQQRDIGRQP